MNSLLEKVIHKLNCEELIEQEKNQYQNSKKESPLGTKFELHQCTLCKIDYDCIQKFIMHLKHKHSFVRNFKCEMCGKAFKTRGQLKDHITRRHNDVRKHSCLQCHREYIYESHLKIHIRRYHNKERSYICKHCEKGNKLIYVRENIISYFLFFSGFFDLFELKQHRKTHVGINYVI